jgi:translation elongation factor EF-Tu-like GTPase
MSNQKFEAKVHIHVALMNYTRIQFDFGKGDVAGVMTLPFAVMPGDHVTIELMLLDPATIKEGFSFTIRDGGKTIGTGVISKAPPASETSESGMPPKSNLDWIVNKMHGLWTGHS